MTPHTPMSKLRSENHNYAYDYNETYNKLHYNYFTRDRNLLS